MDIDDRNSPEQGSQQRVEESAEAVERLRSILDHVIDGIVTIDEILEALSALDFGPKGPPGGKPAIEVNVESCDDRVKSGDQV